MAFDQRISPEAVLETIKATTGNTVFPLRLATADEISGADERASQSAKRSLEGRWLVFRPVEPFPSDKQITITVGPGTPSLEGPLTTTEPYTCSARTVRCAS